MTDPGWTPLAQVAEDAEDTARYALAEDGTDDVTSRLTVPSAARGRGRLECRTATVLAGTAYADAVARIAGFGPVTWHAADGQAIEAGTVVGEVEGPVRAVLFGERTLLNLLQRACGIASATRACADAIAHTRCRVLHTRKTAPGLRLLDVHAVLAGGGVLHRLDLAHQVMVKDNHWRALERDGGTLARALAAARNEGVESLQVEVETEAQLREACEAGATRLLLDNQSPTTVAAWGALARELRAGIEIEATGGITPETLVQYAEAGVDYVSLGWLTHSVRAADIGLELEPLAA